MKKILLFTISALVALALCSCAATSQRLAELGERAQELADQKADEAASVPTQGAIGTTTTGGAAKTDISSGGAVPLITFLGAEDWAAQARETPPVEVTYQYNTCLESGEVVSFTDASVIEHMLQAVEEMEVTSLKPTAASTAEYIYYNFIMDDGSRMTFSFQNGMYKKDGGLYAVSGFERLDAILFGGAPDRLPVTEATPNPEIYDLATDFEGTVAEINQYSSIELPLLTSYTEEISAALIEASGGDWVENYMSDDYYCDGITFIFAGYPDDESPYALTKVVVSSPEYNIMAITPGDDAQKAETLLSQLGYTMDEDGYYDKAGVKIGLAIEEGVISEVEVYIPSEYLGHRLY